MSNGEVRALTAREQIAAMLRYQHEERMARATTGATPSYTIEQKSPAGKHSGFEFTISHPVCEAFPTPEAAQEAAEELAKRWRSEFPGPEPVVKA